MELRVEGHEGPFMSIMIPMASIPSKVLPYPTGKKFHQRNSNRCIQ